ncbi:class I SAM-dependent methyltransferase [Paraburkholderia fungorum]|jgi:SAM-dependent methyltransferase|uniref:class I SAM-dependent methyltransferase n=1 Tax=Paraburkholderia fungorum TaxID=134537 RepID=UPI0038BB6D9E
MTNAVLQDLIARVKAEAAAHASPDDTDAMPALARPVGAFVASPDTTDLADRSTLERLFTLGNQAFVDAAYRFVLQREADGVGRHNYASQLASGTSRLVVLAKLRMSAEGRRAGVPLTGLRIAIAMAAAQRLLHRVGLGAVALRAGKAVDGFYARRVVSRSLVAWRRRFENTVDVLLTMSQRMVDLREELAPTPVVSPETIDAYYLAFEDANRGTRESVLAKLAIYNDWLATCVPETDGLAHQIVDIGCGRGEWISYVRQKGRDAIGIDVNRVMVEACLAQGFNVRCTDALGYLRSLPTGSVAAVTGFHIIEHLPFDYLFALVQESYRVLVEGGSVLFETPNPENVLVGSHTFYHDFTHRNPVTPSAITFLLKYHQFEEIDIVRSSPYPEEAKVPGNDPLTERVNGHLCGPQDFAVLGRKRAAAGVQA